MLIHFARLGFPWFVGLPYEYFRVKKIDRKGDLKVEITAQVYPQDFYDLIEDVEQEPPTIAGPPERNPGGRPDEQPFHVGFGDIGFGNDKVHFRLNPFAIE
jgi:hypothetical protein